MRNGIRGDIPYLPGMQQRLLLALGFALLVNASNLYAQDDYYADGYWPGIPGMNDDGIALRNQRTFLFLLGTATASYIASEHLQVETNLNYYQARAGVYGASDSTTLALQTFGIEKRMSHWFGLGFEGLVQEWKTNSPDTPTALGLGLNTYYRWHALGKRKLSPFLEYGAGIFSGFQPLPYNGTRFTFHLTTSVGLEYTWDTRNKFRLSYGHLHQSNNGLFDVNPGLIGNGLQAQFLFFWAESEG